ncbi:hypothetical protein A6F53_05220 [Levilactobacillus brevis]|uniref:hypothetical protein n=1 Tax=Levilactobacillus brevis TaxID=1580 RepID=UPI0007F89CE2|nr:hypothetical protein [Levilactobacillus brevis]ANN48678.1 hypothetical protein A6F53_05220 [Levilactobacillus brevis]
MALDTENKNLYSKDYASEILKFISSKSMTPSTVESFFRSVNSGRQFDFHHEKIAKAVYEIDDASIVILKINCQTIETSPFDNDKITKFISSIRLSITQRDFILENIKIAGAEAKKIENTKSQIYTDIISVLGIFSALIFALFGGVSTVAQTMSGLASGVRLSRIVLMFSLISMGLVVLIFLLLNGISGMVGKKMKVCCDDEKCRHTPFQRYPFFVIGIMGSLVLMGASVVVILFDYHKVLYDHWIVSSIVFIILFLSTMLRLYRTLTSKKK